MNLGDLRPQFKDYILTRNQTTNDLLNGIVKAINESDKGAEVVAKIFKRKNRFLTCFVLYEYMKRNLYYKAEPKDDQSVKTLQRIIHDKKGDCKHYTIFASAILKALHIPFRMRLISQDREDKSPTHIYLIVKDENNNWMVLDPCMSKFNKECPYTYNYDYSIN